MRHVEILSVFMILSKPSGKQRLLISLSSVSYGTFLPNFETWRIGFTSTTGTSAVSACFFLAD